MPEAHPLQSLNGAATPVIQVTGEPESVRPGHHHATFVVGDDDEDARGRSSSRRSSRRSLNGQAGASQDKEKEKRDGTGNGNGVGKPAPKDTAPTTPAKPPSAFDKAYASLMKTKYFSWIKPKLNWNSIKIVIRVAVSVSSALRAAPGQVLTPHRCGSGLS